MTFRIKAYCAVEKKGRQSVLAVAIQQSQSAEKEQLTICGFDR